MWVGSTGRRGCDGSDCTRRDIDRQKEFAGAGIRGGRLCARRRARIACIRPVGSDGDVGRGDEGGLLCGGASGSGNWRKNWGAHFLYMQVQERTSCEARSIEV